MATTQMDVTISKTELACLTTCALLLLSYHIYLLYNIRKHGERTIFGISRAAKRKWLLNMMKKKNDVAIIQGLRNQVMASTFLASTAVSISSALAAFASRTPTSHHTSLHLLPLLTTHLLTFFLFTQSIRYYNHLMFLAESDVWDEFNVDGSGWKMLDNAGMFFTLGLRG
ncbi:hypothetical protein HK097_008507, partial [Rhizophlyctis rosea]